MELLLVHFLVQVLVQLPLQLVQVLEALLGQVLEALVVQVLEALVLMLVEVLAQVVEALVMIVVAMQVAEQRKRKKATLPLCLPLQLSPWLSLPFLWSEEPAMTLGLSRIAV
jgi:hypothetical protein